MEVEIMYPLNDDCSPRVFIEAERELHRRYADHRVNGSEFFALSPEQVAEIKQIERM